MDHTMKIAVKVHGVEMSRYLVTLPEGLGDQPRPPSDFVAEARRLFAMGWAPPHEVEQAEFMVISGHR